MGFCYNNVNDLLSKIKNSFSLRHCVISIVMAWCFVSVVQTLFVNIKYGYAVNVLEFTGKINYLLNIALVVVLSGVIYAVYMKIKKPLIERVALFMALCQEWG